MRTPSLLLAAAAAAFATLLLAPSGDAWPGYYISWADRYPTSASGPNVFNGTGNYCQLCHVGTNGGSPWNGYGWSLRSHILSGLTITQALAAVEGVDSDGSGATNLAEIGAGTQPGWRLGATNTWYFDNGSTQGGKLAPSGILGALDPSQFWTNFCPGDGTQSPCPCQNEGDLGTGCANSTGVGARLSAAGSASVAAADLVLLGEQLVPSTPGLYFQGTLKAGGGSGVHFGDGLRCAAGAVIRLQVVVSGASGQSASSANLVAAGGVQAGSTHTYQLWYRDPSASPCGGGFNLTQGVEITWQP